MPQSIGVFISTTSNNIFSLSNSAAVALSNEAIVRATADSVNSNAFFVTLSNEASQRSILSANVAASNFWNSSSMTWSTLSNFVTYQNLGSVPTSSFSNTSIPVGAIQNVGTSEAFMTFVNQALSNINVTSTLSNAIVNIAQELTTNTTYAMLGQVPLAQLTNVTPAAIGAPTLAAFQAESNALLAFQNSLNSNVTTSNLVVYNNISGSNINVTGYITALGDITALSDRRIKSEFQVIPDALEKINAIHGYTFLKQNSTKRHAGVIAQEIEAVMPEVVFDDSELGYKSVAYGNISALLIESIRELMARLEKVEALLGLCPNTPPGPAALDPPSPA